MSNSNGNGNIDSFQSTNNNNNVTILDYKDLLKIKDEIFLKRLESIKDFFENEYGHEPEFFVKVPGRVNIIGEHIDYCGYPVLPMALEQCILLAASKNIEGFLHLKNSDKKYGNYKCEMKSVRIDLPSSGSPQWYNYFLCGIKGILDHLNNVLPTNFGMSIVINGNVPPAAGLSSSSALVSAATLTMAFIYKVNLNKNLLASIAAKCERYIGTQGGGMDQAIAFLAKKGCAQFIEFHPELNATSVKLPDNAYFVVANSLTQINKAATSDFNERVIECRLSCRILAKRCNFNNWKDITKFIHLQNLLQCNLYELEQLILNELTKDIYTIDDILEEFNISENELIMNFLTENTKDMKMFKLKQRALHVIQESIRVNKFRNLCESDSLSIDMLSQLMKGSHNSLRHLYECSHTNLNKLVELSEEVGVTGARLTGAGWGGCIVALCDSPEQCQRFIQELKEKYYSQLPQAKNKNLDEVIFSTCPQSGAEIYLC
ncbi:N-acetylgalactosamine kinase [Condylostylus longicornis]|uniref:N-acetylgalactosamine kinase n=1 Tax=Condylostylus longicornis TaxID=2530218 RepID=UPI00244DE04B|nr:N-acetylgalactosamine kinase [Condylostylus longicornis]